VGEKNKVGTTRMKPNHVSNAQENREERNTVKIGGNVNRERRRAC